MPDSASRQRPGQAQPAAVTFLDQGWTEAERQTYYHTTQGTRVIPYSWFLALEQPSLLSREPFLTDAMVTRFGLLPDHNTFIA